jgi:hypothetical protein
MTLAKRFRARVGTPAALIICVASILSCEGVRSTGLATHPSLAPVPPRMQVNVGEYLKAYIHAHQDNWELFMSDRVSSGLQSVPNVVFIYTTAGDGGNTTSWWQTRELAAQAGMDVLVGPGAWTCAPRTINTHAILRCGKGAAIAYNMRLPSCAMSSDGYAGRGCLSDLRDGYRSSLVALDGSATYTSWADLVTTVRGIIDYESNNQGAPFVEVNSPDYDRVANKPNHPDNLATADLVLAASASRSWNISWFIDYNTMNLPVNLSQTVHDIKRDAYYAYDNYMGAAGLGRGQWEPEYQAWLWRTYFRTTISVPPPPPATPTGLQAQASSATQITLNWTTPSTNATGFNVERAPDNSGAPGTYAQIAQVSASTLTYSSTGLGSSTRYWFRVRAFNSSDVSGYSNEANATTLVTPATPTNLAGSGISSSRIDLSWTDNATNETGYQLDRAPDNAGTAGTFAQIASLAAGATTYSNTGLNANTRYWYRIRAVNATDASAYSSLLSVSSLQGLAAPTALQAQVISGTQINLTWTDNTTTETNYTVERAPDNAGVAGTFASIATLAANAAGYSDASVSQNTRYWYRVRAFNALDISPYSAQISATTPLLPPSAPSSLQGQGMSASRIDLTWTDNASNESSFLVEQASDNAGAPGTFTQIGSVAANVVSFASNGLAPSTRYWFRVRASNTAGNSAYTTSVSATTLAAPTSRTDFYVHAHQDDWELFMGDRAYTSGQVATKVVIVYTTAGDGGETTSWWQTREVAARAAVDAIAPSAGAWNCVPQTINAHAIRRCSKGKAVSYEMRLPSCAMNSEGYFGRGCLSDIRDGYRSTLVALDGSATYTSWADISNTIRGIIDVESNNQSAPYVEVNAPDYNRVTNKPNHPDHLATADLVHLAAGTRNWTTFWYIDYPTQNMPINLSQSVHDLKRDVYYAYDNYMGNAGLGRGQYEADHQAWLWRTYFRQGP